MNDRLPLADTFALRTETIRWWHWASAAGLILIFILITPRGQSPEFAGLVEGSVSPTKIIAPFDFEILKSAEELAAERREAALTVLPVLIRSDSTSDLFVREILRFGNETHRALSALPPELIARLVDPNKGKLEHEDSVRIVADRDRLFKQFGFRLSNTTWKVLYTLTQFDHQTSPGLYFRFFEDVLVNTLRDIYGQGVINVPRSQLQHPSSKVTVQYEGEESDIDLARVLTPDEALGKISNLLPEKLKGGGFPTGSVSAGYEILQTFTAANLIFDSQETDRRRQAAVAKVPLARGLVKRNELIIDQNIVVTAEHLAKLRSLSVKRAELERDKGGLKVLLPIIGYFLIFGLLISLFFLYILLTRFRIWNDWKLIVLTALLLSLAHIFQSLVLVNYELSRFLFPAAVFAMLFGILIDRGVAIGGVVLMALIAGLLRGNDYIAAFTTIIVGSSSVYAIRKVRNRGDVMQATVYLLCAYIPIVLATHFIQYNYDDRLWRDLGFAGFNAILSPILVLGLGFLFERAFNITTDLTLLELVDLNRPLLRELAIKSPGTYHHSIMVGSLAESAARAIGANALLTRAGAYYHDIGKMVNKEFFIENQETGSENIHDRLPPSKSAEIVINHVTYGLKLADEHNLPEQIKAFISEHHGRSRLVYFYSKAKRELGENVPDDRFRYPGPNPRSKETAILMLADTIEAAARSEEADSPEELEALVDKLIRNRLNDGDLDDCGLTLREIWTIRDSFVQTIAGIHHQRIAYPDDDQTPQLATGTTYDKRKRK